VRPHRRRRQGRLEPRARAAPPRPRGHRRRVGPRPLRDGRGGARPLRAVRRRLGAVGARARRDRARRHGRGRDRRRRGQHPHLPGRTREVRRRAHHRPLQQPAQLPALRAARGQAGGLRHRPDPAPDRARGSQVRSPPPARPSSGAARDHRARRRRGLSRGRSAGRGRRAPRRRAGHLHPPRRDGLRAHRRVGDQRRRRGPARPRPRPRGVGHGLLHVGRGHARGV
ncbi:MAG: Trk system potassium uptake protein TrkA, partial [uncultured Solirubrobacterales bacterium]